MIGVRLAHTRAGCRYGPGSSERLLAAPAGESSMGLLCDAYFSSITRRSAPWSYSVIASNAARNPGTSPWRRVSAFRSCPYQLRPTRVRPWPTWPACPLVVGRRGLQHFLNRAAEILTGGLTKSALTVDWAAVRRQHVAALRATLIEAKGKPTTINHILSVVRGTMREACRLGLIDAKALAGVITVGKVRTVYCPAGGKAAIDDWIERRGAWPGALLCPVKKGGYVQQRGMTDQAIMMRLLYLARRARVSHFAPQDLRRSCIGELLVAGADIAAVHQLAGYASVRATQRDDRRSEEATRRRTAKLLYVPYSHPHRSATPPSAAPAKDSAPVSP